MISFNATRQIRIKRRRSTRRAQKEVILRSNLRSDISAESDEESDPLDTSPIDTTAQDTLDVAFVSRNNYTADDFDENDLFFPENSGENEFTSLFDGSDVSVRATVHHLVAFLIDSNLGKRKSTRLLQLIKSLLPQPNRLPKTWNCLMKLIGRSTKSMTTFLCGKCHQRWVKFSSSSRSKNQREWIACPTLNLEYVIFSLH